MRSRMIYSVWVAIIVFLGLACAPRDNGAGSQAKNALSFEGAYVYAPAPTQTRLAGYWAIRSSSSTMQRIVKITSPVVEKIELHRHIHDDGVMKMRELATLDVSPSETIAFEPGGYHLMFFGIENITKVRESVFPVTVHLESGEQISVEFSVRER